MRYPLSTKGLAFWLIPLVLFMGTTTSLFGAETARRALHGHIPGVVRRLAPEGQLAANTNLSLAIGLPVRNPAQLDEFLRQLQDPASTNYHKYITPQEFTARFGPTPEQYQTVVNFARSNGFTVVGTHPNRMVLDVTATATNIERTFRLHLRTYKHPREARSFYAPDTEPSVPANVPVADVDGLSDYSRPHPLLSAAKAALAQPLGGSGPSGLYAGNDFRKAYVPGTTLTGAGQAVGLLEFSAYYQADITNYENTIGLTNYVPLNDVVVTHTAPSTANNAEVALDIEVAIAMAPKLSQIIVYESSGSVTSMLNRMATDNLAKQLSSSWSWSGGPNATVETALKQMAAQGQTFFQASGDNDAYTGANLLDDTSLTVAPVDSTNVIAVGGTTLTMSGSGAAWSSEKVWNYHSFGGSFANEGSGGGISAYYTIPPWQTNVSMANNSGSTVWRNVPDVAMTADQIYVAYNNGSSGGFAGTSCAAPLWAGFCALVNEQSANVGASPVGFINPALYAIANSANYSSCFHDITSGNNIGTNAANLYYATNGYDLCTGLGTPNGTNLINALVLNPYILSAPTGLTATNGDTVSLSVTAAGQGPLAYQWQRNGTNLTDGGNISGTTGSVLSLTSVTTNNTGDYRVIVTNSYSAVTSSVATLTVVYPPSFTAQPTNLTVLVGDPAAFSATVAGAGPLNYRWQLNGTNLVDGGNRSGSSGTTLSLASTTLSDAGDYTLVVTNVFGAVTSSPATLTIHQPAVITIPPAPAAIECGNNASFNVTASGDAPLSYQWNMDGAPVSGATSTNLQLTGVHLPNHVITVVVTNVYGSATNSVILTVQDTIGPAITLNGSNPLLVELGSAFADPGASASDACAGSVAVAVSGTVNPNALSTNTLTYSAADSNGNTNTLTRTVIVQDTTPPTLQSQVTNVVLTADAGCSATLPDLTTTNYLAAADLSTPLTLSQDPTNGAILSSGTYAVVVTATDAQGNSATATNTVTVQDVTPPSLALNGTDPIILELGSSFVDPGASATDACAGVVAVMVSGTVNSNSASTNLLTYSATDGNGNTNTVTRTVIVQDTTPPSLQWLVTNLVLNADATCSVPLPDLTATNYLTASDLSAPITLTQDPTNGATLAPGDYSVAVTATDAQGNSATITNTVTVHDATPPLISLNGSNPLTVELGGSFTDPGASATDACAGAVAVIATGTVDPNTVGTNTLTYFAADGNGNTNTVTRTVIVQDTTPPLLQWQVSNVVLTADATCNTALPNLTTTNYLVATDLSVPLTLSQDPTNGANLSAGTYAVTVTATDAQGNSATATNTVTVQDVTPPVLTLNGSNPLLIELGSSFTDPGASATDACAGTVAVTVSGTVNPNAVGTNMLTYFATDGSGNTNTLTRTVVVRDTTPPVLQWLVTNLVVNADASCSAILPDLTATNYLVATDLSVPVTLTQNPTNGASVAPGTYAVITTARDAQGNVTTATNTVMVKDVTPPTLTLNGSNSLIVELGGSFTDPGASATDACVGTVAVTISGTVNANAIGTNTLTYSTTDGNGNTNALTRTVVVRDTTPPALQWLVTNVVLNANASCSAVLPNLTGTNYLLATDLSAPLTLSQNPTTGASVSPGTYAVVVTATDARGNSATATNTVTVRDVTPPTMTLNGSNPAIVELGGSFTDPGASATDACVGIVAVTRSGTVNVNAGGTNTLTYSATDGNGNTNSITRTVVVRDTTPPVLQWLVTNVVLNANSSCSTALPNLAATNYLIATDLSTPLSFSQNPASGAALAPGSYAVVVTATDAAGNAANATNTVTVQDVTPPAILTQPQSQTNNAGTTVTFSLTAQACSPLGYQWYFNQAALTGQTNSVLTLTNLNSTLAGNYLAVARSVGGARTSAVAALTVNLLTPALALGSSENPAGFKDSLKFTGSLTSTNVTGTVQFFTNNILFNSQAVVAGTATSSSNNLLPRGQILITAIYSGNTQYRAVTNTLLQTITNHPPVVGAFATNRYAGLPLSLPVAVLASNWSDADGDPIALAGINPSTNGVLVTNSAGTLVYANSNNVDDKFTCTVSDGWGGTNYQTVSITVVPLPSDATPGIINVAPSTNNTVHFLFTGSPGFTYVLETATNLIPTAVWQPVATNTLTSSGIWDFIDVTTGKPRQFYRLKLAY
ncbi:MAG TPA: immunoglobulin-like domain-containing protein [Dongiaceae bacterium]|nr:immunoglobulin-like domain-containing protein [Dongiaceae bacterium]